VKFLGEYGFQEKLRFDEWALKTVNLSSDLSDVGQKMNECASLMTFSEACEKDTELSGKNYMNW